MTAARKWWEDEPVVEPEQFEADCEPAPGIYHPDQVQRKLWQPDAAEQARAAETLLSSPIPYELRTMLRGFHDTLDRRKAS